MKTRTGFVSNSSSSSFIAYGAITDRDGAYDIIDQLAPGKIFETFAQKINDYYTKEKKEGFVPFTEDSEEFRIQLKETMHDGWPVDYNDLFNQVDLPMPMEDLYEDDEVVFGYMVDTEDQWGTEKVFGETFSQDKVDKVDGILSAMNIKPNLLMGRRAC